MQRGSSVNFQPVHSATHAVTHASREVAPTYLLPPEHSLGTIVVLDDNGEVAQTLEAKMAMASRQALAVKDYSPMWEGVLNLRRPEPDEDAKSYKKECTEVVKEWCTKYEVMTGHKVLRADVHLDEGHMIEGVPILNSHAHIICDKTNDKGRVIKLTPQKLRELQTATAEITNLERGVNSRISGKKHITAHQYKYLAERNQLENQKVKIQLEAKVQEVQVLEAKLAGEPERLRLALIVEKYRLDREEFKRLNAEALAAGLDKPKSQKDYSELKKAHDLALAEGAKVPKLQKQIDQLTPEAAKVPGLEAQALELAQLKERITAAKARVAAKSEPVIDPRSRYHPDNIAKREAQEAATAAAKPAPRVMPKIEPKAVERVRPVATQPKPTPQQEAKAQNAQKLAELASQPMSSQVQIFDFTLTKFTQIRQEKLNRVSAKVLKRQERRGKALQAVFNSRPPEPTGMLAALKRGAYDKALDALEPVYQRARKLAKQAETLTQKVAEAAKQAHSWAYARLKKADPSLVQRVETHRYDERMEASRRQREEREAQKALNGPDKGMSR